MTKYKALIFDADDTLFDFQMAEKNALQVTLTSFDIPYSLELHQTYKAISKRLWGALEQGLITQETLKYQRFEELYDLIGKEGPSAPIAEKYLKNLSKQGVLIEGALEMIKSLSEHYRLFIITNGITEVQEGRFKDSPLMAYIEGMVISEQVGTNKPDPKIFTYFNERFGPFEKDELLIIGDSLSSDILGGINYGIDSCWYNPDENCSGAVQPTLKVKSYSELLSILL